MILSEIHEGRYYAEERETVAWDMEYDIVICGLGTAGSVAAILAAQKGFRVLGIEAYTCVGGTTTIGGIQGHYFGLPGGVYESLNHKVKEFHDRYSCSGMESKKLQLEAMMRENSVSLMYESCVCGVYSENRQIVGVCLICPDGRKNVACRYAMDCTGDAAVAYIAGCSFEFGRDFDGLTQPYSMVSTVLTGGGVGFTNHDFGRVDPRDDWAFTKALLFSRSYHLPEETHNNGLFHMPLLGIREGRRIISEETVHLKDIFCNHGTDTPAFFSYADLDKHGWDIAFDDELMTDWAIGANLGAYNIMIPVSYKTIIPKGMEGLLVPCRALGVDRNVSSCVRMVPDMKKAAEAAVYEVILADRHHCKLKDIPYGELREMLLETGCLKENQRISYYIDGLRNPDGTRVKPKEVFWIHDKEELCETLRTRCPGRAIWSVRYWDTGKLDFLYKFMEQNPKSGSMEENLQRHAAFALAMKKDAYCLPVLRKMLFERDGVVLEDCRKHNQTRGCMAIYYLGKFHDATVTDELIELITNPDEVKKKVYAEHSGISTRYQVADFRDVYFQFLSNALRALIRIGTANPDLKTKIQSAFHAAFDNEEYIKRITERPKESSEGGMAYQLKIVADLFS